MSGAAGRDAVAVDSTTEGDTVKPERVTLTIQPSEVVEVTGAELVDLERQGLVHGYPDRDPKPAEKTDTKKGR